MPAPAQFSIGVVLAESMRAFRRHWRRLLLLAAAIEVPLVLAEVILHVTPSLRGLAAEESLEGVVALLTIYGALSHHFLAGVLERVVSADRQGRPSPGFREVVHHLPWHRLIVADLVLTTLTIIGLAALVVPGIVVATWFALTLPIINLEDRRVLSAFGRSRQLVRGHGWRVGVLAVGTFVIPEALLAWIAIATHTGNTAIDLVVHAVPAVLVLPVAALPIVLAAFALVDLETNSAGGG